MRRFRPFGLLVLTAATWLSTIDVQAREKWTPEQANAWYDGQPWLVGANYAPAYAINQLEFWQADTFDPEAIDRELKWAHDLGFTSLRVYLHHLLWEQDREGFLKRLETFLEIADKHEIGVMFVLFDSVWDPHPKLGKQRAPQQGLHNSGWVQSPGVDDLKDPARHKLLEEYVRGVVGHFKDDDRVDVWDLWNEPDNTNGNSYGKNKLKQEPEDKVALVLPLLKKSFEWARKENPSQPLTSGVWIGNWSDPDKLSPTERVQLEESDVISFHSYDPLDKAKRCVENLKRYDRPLLCTEYMARPNGSTFDPVLGYFKEQNIGAYCWGFVAGKSNTIYPWDSWQKPYDAEPPVWFHDIFREDGTPYRPKEVEYIKSVTGAANEK
ncbi:MAG: cellulase family glycosylhydrolase [Planctomycetaceae bacterium]